MVQYLKGCLATALSTLDPPLVQWPRVCVTQALQDFHTYYEAR